MSSAKLSITPLTSLRTTRHSIPRYARFPNTALQHKPLLIYHAVFPNDTTPAQIESHIRAVGVCEPQWGFSMYKTSHFHSTTHELLAVLSGRATLLFGGEDNPGRVEETNMCYGKEDEEGVEERIRDLEWFGRDQCMPRKDL
ncbi:hypothetical protein BDY19DRAFT_984418 [Irpex rosettiformis]|uniref:Uncharacterized protein n=1 Tax=Irpex rosettiformis TaxID=378272 RepID=A0ACB8U9D7_9APHY|nr:hypothetical protein BDY19DRAFT_984418 [Irpex rosettiformis]